MPSLDPTSINNDPDKSAKSDDDKSDKKNASPTPMSPGEDSKEESSSFKDMDEVSLYDAMLKAQGQGDEEEKKSEQTKQSDMGRDPESGAAPGAMP